MTNVAACAVCSMPPEAGHPLPLCRPCRSNLAGRPFPKAIRLAGGLVALAVLVGAGLAPRSIDGAVAFERGERAQQRGDFAEAARQFGQAFEVFPDSPKVVIRLAAALAKSGRKEEGAQLVNAKLVGIKLPQEIVKEANALFGNPVVPAAKLKEGI